MNSYEAKMYAGLLPKEPLKGKQGFYPVCNAEEWEKLPLPYKVMQWEPVPDYKDQGRPKKVKAVTFDVTFLEPYKVSAKVSVHPQEVQKILFCLYDRTDCHLYSICGIELEGGTRLGAKWLQDSVSGAFGIVTNGQFVAQQGGFRGFIPERVFVNKSGEFEYNWNFPGGKTAFYELSNPFNGLAGRKVEAVAETAKDATEKLMDAMVEYAQEGAWNDSDCIEALLECGITEEDFKKYGKWDSVKEYFEDEKPSLEEKMGEARAEEPQMNSGIEMPVKGQDR